MELLLDDPGTEKLFKEILTKIRLRKNGETVAQMKRMGLTYKISWGVSVIHLRELAKNYERNHLLALKLWNKGWRESMMLATMLEEPNELSEAQMDYWTKSCETGEMVEQLTTNLLVYTKYAFVKALEYCCGKKHLVRYAGLLMVGRLAMVDKKAINEMFEPFLTVMIPLSKDQQLAEIFYRTMVLMAGRNKDLRATCAEFAQGLKALEEEQSQKMADLLLEEFAAMDEWEAGEAEKSSGE